MTLHKKGLLLTHKSDTQIARETKPLHVREIAAKAGLAENEIDYYGSNKAKIKFEAIEKRKNLPNGKLILVTAMTPTKMGEGKTTTSIALAQGLAKAGKKPVLCLREPSLGPCFGVKGGAAGGGYSQVVPMDEINLHFTGDIHAIGTTHNLLSALLDNHLFQGNELGIDVSKVSWRRVVDLNDRALRSIRIGLNGQGIERDTGFDITVASEIMAIFCLSNDLKELQQRLGRIIVARDKTGKPITADQLKATGSLAVLLKDALKPNLVQSLEGVPALVHGGPFANIAHGTNTIIATKLGLKLGDYVVTEAGFGSDLGAEKYFDIVSRQAGFSPSCVVLVATIRALKLHGGADANNLTVEDVAAVEKGIPNLSKHLENMQGFGVPVVVAVNRFPLDTEAEIAKVHDMCKKHGAEAVLCEGWARGGDGAKELAQRVVKEIADYDKKPNKKINYTFELEWPLKKKIEAVCTKIYGADGVDYSPEAEAQLADYEKLGFGKLPVCMAKTQMSLSDDKNKPCRPTGFRVTVREARLSAGAGFVVAIAGDIMTMPGLPKSPAAERIYLNEKGEIEGLF